MLKHIIAAFLVTCSGLTNTISYWNWPQIDVTRLQFPDSFQWGTSMIAREVEGNTTNNTFATYAGHIKKNGQTFEATPIGIACDHWNRYQKDIDLMVENGLTSLCYALDWSKIEPTQGNFDETALAHYANEFAYAKHRGMHVTIILKEYSDPQWFLERGGFETTQNIALFERYCQKVCSALQGNVNNYITFWCPDSYAILGYWNDSHPPFKHDMQQMGTVLKNIFEAHVRAYEIIKQTDKTVKVGIVKHVHRLYPVYPWDKLACLFADRLTDTPFYDFFTKGTFSIKISFPGIFKISVEHTNKKAPQSLDFIGINYHTHGFIRNFRRLETNNPKEIATDIPGFTLYPEGLYHAIKEVSYRLAKRLNIPIYITQNGVATTDDSIRTIHAKRHLYAMSHAIKQGHNVQGYFYYSLLDGHSWGGYDKKFGLFSVNRTTMKRSLKPGAHYYLNVVNTFNNKA